MISRLTYALLLSAFLLSACQMDAREDPSVAAANASQPAADSLLVLFMGNSLTAGYGLSNFEQAFPARLDARIDSLGLPVRTVAAGVSGETTGGGLQRIGWLLDQYAPDILVLELGGNDGLRGVPPATVRSNLEAIIDSTRSRYPSARVVLTGMQMPPSMGRAYARAFQQVYPRIADADPAVTLVPFLMEGVGGVEKMMQRDGIHPTARGHERMAGNVWPILKSALEVRLAEEQPESAAAPPTR